MIITLLSDWGTKDATAALAKAALMRLVPGAEVVDISHGVVRHSQRQAAYMLASFYKNYPVGTVHICPVAVFVGKAPCMILAKHNGHFFIAPDNGLLPLAFGDMLAGLCATYVKPYSLTKWLEDAGKITQAISRGSVPVNFDFIPQALKPLPSPQVMHGGIECQVLFTDRYGNVVLNITQQAFGKLIGVRPFEIQTMKGSGITSVSNSYTDVGPGMPLCRFNSAGLLEIAVNHGAATELLGFGQEDIANLRYSTVRIFV